VRVPVVRGGMATSGGTGSITPSRDRLGLVLAILVSGLLALVSACESLVTETSALSDTPTQTIATPATDTAQAFFGAWEGTYTVHEVRDQDGAVTDPPVPLNTPLEMHLELHAWSEASGDCGNVMVAGYPSGRVLEFSTEGQEGRLLVVNEQEGLEDLRSVMSLTLHSDTLTGEDEPDPVVPHGWYATTGSVQLMRAVSPVTSATEASAEVDTGEPPDASTEETGPVVTLFLHAYALTTTTTEREPTYWEWDMGDDGRSKEIRVGDHLTVMLDLGAVGAWTADWGSTAPAVLQEAEPVRTHVPQSRCVFAGYEAVAPGNVGLFALLYHQDGTFHDAWNVSVRIIE